MDIPNETLERTGYLLRVVSKFLENNPDCEIEYDEISVGGSHLYQELATLADKLVSPVLRRKRYKATVEIKDGTLVTQDSHVKVWENPEDDLLTFTGNWSGHFWELSSDDSSDRIVIDKFDDVEIIDLLDYAYTYS